MGWFISIPPDIVIVSLFRVSPNTLYVTPKLSTARTFMTNSSGLVQTRRPEENYLL
ncbi:unnamed protein product [Amoebophrya sp. A25]|nr:unnamed protein product [Amoebophrya sp. A25]CAD7964184.1 unnamed protein product [Amoebophrya sp. A25]|eukprot:GSA25T00019584001.1